MALIQLMQMCSLHLHLHAQWQGLSSMKFSMAYHSITLTKGMVILFNSSDKYGSVCTYILSKLLVTHQAKICRISLFSLDLGQTEIHMWASIMTTFFPMHMKNLITALDVVVTHMDIPMIVVLSSTMLRIKWAMEEVITFLHALPKLVLALNNVSFLKSH